MAAKITPPKITPPKISVMRSQLGRVRGAGAARSGVEHWQVERLTALALIPLTLWFLISVISMLGATALSTLLVWVTAYAKLGG